MSQHQTATPRSNHYREIKHRCNSRWGLDTPAV